MAWRRCCCCNNCTNTGSQYQVVFADWIACTCISHSGSPPTASAKVLSGTLNGTWTLSKTSSCVYAVSTGLYVRNYSSLGCAGSSTDSEIIITLSLNRDAFTGDYSRILSVVGGSFSLFTDSLFDGATKPDCAEIDFTNDWSGCGNTNVGYSGTATATAI